MPVTMMLYFILLVIFVTLVSMANEVKLEVYTFKIKRRYEKDYLNLDTFFENNDFFSFFQDFINSYSSEIAVDEIYKKSIQFKTDSTSIHSNTRMISGVIESGEYGIEGRIVNRKTKQTAYQKKADDIDIKPFYFLIHAPKEHTTGMLILQRIGHYGINGILTRTINDLFKKKYSDYIIKFAPFLSKKLAKELINKDSIREIRLRRYGLPTDIIDKLELKGHDEKVLSIEIKITAKNNSYLPLNNKVKKFVLNPDTAFFDIPEMTKLGFDGKNETSIRVGVGNSSRVVDLKESFQLRPYYDIDQDVEKKSGNPVFNSIE